MTTKEKGERPVPRKTSAELREELAHAEVAKADAHAAMDIEAFDHAERRIHVLREFVAKQERAEQVERVAEAKKRAAEFLAHRAGELGAIRAADEIDAAVAREACDTLVKALGQITARHKNGNGVARAFDVLRTRFPDLPGAAALVPDLRGLLPDLAAIVADATTTLYHTARRESLKLNVVRVASDTPEETRSNVLRALNEWLSSSAKTLPPEVQRILADAPVPTDVLPPPREPSAQAQRAGAAMAQAVAATRAALDAVPSHSPLDCNL